MLYDRDQKTVAILKLATGEKNKANHHAGSFLVQNNP